MKIRINTQVAADHNVVRSGFNERLFLALNPPFPPVRLLRFDGCRRGDRVVLRLNFMLFSQVWESLIVDDTADKAGFSFTDRGVRLPFFLSFWEHRHVVQSHAEGGSVITDDIEFRSPFRWTDFLLYPVIYLQFLYRKPIYRKLFAG